MFYSSGMFEPRAPNAERIKSGRGDVRLALASCVWYNSLQSETEGGLFTEKRSFFFDLYGTLVDVRTDEKMPSLWRGMARYCSLGGAAYAPSELRTRYLALCAQETAALVQKSGLPEREVEIELRRVFRRLYAEKGVRVSAARLNDTAIAFRALSYTRTPRLIPGARRTLDELRRRGAKLFLLSNAQSCFTVPELRLLALSDSFDGVFLSSDFGCKKPSPAFFRGAMAAAGITAEGLVMVGNDADADIRGADGCRIESRYYHTHQSPPRSGALPESCREIWALTDLLL